MFAISRGPHKSIVLSERMQLVNGPCEVGAHLPIAVIEQCAISLQAMAHYCKSPTSKSPSFYAT